MKYILFLCFIVLLLTVNTILCKPKRIFHHPINNEIQQSRQTQSENSVVEDKEIKPKPNILPECDLNWTGSKCPDVVAMDRIIVINTRNPLYRNTDFEQFDIKLSPEEKEEKTSNARKRRASINRFEWPKNADGNVYIPYETLGLHNDVKINLTNAIKEYENSTCIRIVPRSNELNYLKIIDSGGCWSYVGLRGGIQEMSLSPGCSLMGTIIHEIMHALGFYHEQARRDRDKNVIIHFENIKPDWIRQFEILDYGVGFVMGEEYDPSSVMHYGNKAAAIDINKNTLTSIKDPKMSLGRRDNFSKQDLREINLKYKCGRKYIKY